MFCAPLRYLKADVALVDHILRHTIDFVPEYHGVAPSALRREFLKFNAAFDLFEAA
jgi:hypothetical protein